MKKAKLISCLFLLSLVCSGCNKSDNGYNIYNMDVINPNTKLYTNYKIGIRSLI